MRDGGTNGSALAAALLLAGLSAPAAASDLATYRIFKFGTDVATVAKQTGIDPSRVKILHSRPALIQEFQWRLGSLGPVTERDTAKDLVFTFYEGDLYQIAVNYDHHSTEGMTVGDLTQAISAAYGTALKPGPAAPLWRVATWDLKRWWRNGRMHCIATI